MAGDPLWYYKVLGLHCDGTNGSTTFTDVKGKTVTAVGNAQISTAQYPSLTGKTSSGYVDGTGDYLTVPDSADWDFGTGGFGIRILVRFSGVTTAQALVSNYLNTTTGFSMVFDGVNSKLQFLNGTTALLDVSWIPSVNTWYVIEVSRSGTSLRGFVDGAQVGSTATNSTNITGSTSTLFVGARDSSNQLLTGYFSEVEVYKGAPLNTANYTPSSDPFPNAYVSISGTTKDNTGTLAERLVRIYRRDTGTLFSSIVSNITTGNFSVPAENSGMTTPFKYFAVCHDASGVSANRVLGLHCDGTNGSTTFTEVTGKTVTANGNAQISTAQYPSLTGKTSSALFDGTTDYLSIPNHADFDFGAFDFTIRFLIRTSSTSVTLMGKRPGVSWGPFVLGITAAGKLQVRLGTGSGSFAVDITSTDSINTGSWVDVEVNRNKGLVRMFVAGTVQSSTATLTSALYVVTDPVYIGANGDGTASLNGYLSEIELFKGLALHSASFTPSGNPFNHTSAATENALIFDDITPA